MANVILNEGADLAKTANDVNAADVNGTAKNDAAQNVNVQEAKPAKRNSQPLSTFWGIIGKARRRFEAQLDKTNEIKKRCLEAFMPAVYTDQEKFWIKYMREVSRLLDSKKFGRECDRLKADAMTVATHIVFLGSAKINKVFKNGIVATIGADYKLYVEKFIDEKYERFCLDYEAEDDEANVSQE